MKVDHGRVVASVESSATVATVRSNIPRGCNLRLQADEMTTCLAGESK